MWILYTVRKIESRIELPYDLIDLKTGNEHFVLQFSGFDENQTDYSINMGGVTGKFNVIYQCRGMDCNFRCEITVGNVYEFYISLDSACNAMSGKASLNYYSPDRSSLTFTLDKKGHCLVEGSFKNKDNFCKSGVTFSFETDQTYITGILKSMEIFFRELKRIQGHDTFY